MILCVRVSEFMAVVERGVHPELEGTPLVFLRHSGKQERVYAASNDAEGITSGMRVSQVQTICPEALLLPMTFSHTATKLREVVEMLCEFSEIMEVKDDFQDDLIIYLDVGKLRSADGLYLADAIRYTCSDLHLKAHIGLAAGKFTALMAAQHEGVKMVRPGEEAAFLAPLPIELLSLPREIEHTLRLLGIERMGQVAALSKNAVIGQFGKTGVAGWKLASGQDNRPIRRYCLGKREHIQRLFEDSPIESRELLEWILNDMIHKLAKRLERAASATEQITLILHLEGKQSLEERLQLRQALATPDELRRILNRALEQIQTERPITGIELNCDLLMADLPKQLSLWEYAEAQEHQAERAIARLGERFGADRFLRAVPNEVNHALPERHYRIEALVG